MTYHVGTLTSLPTLPVAHPTVQRLLIDLSKDELIDWCRAQGQSAFRADQILRALYQGKAASFDEIKELPQSLRDSLAKQFRISAGTIVRHLVARDRTEKLLMQYPDQQTVETVLMREESRRTVCVSTQVGCGMGCIFCASGLLGVKRNLSTGEILDQVLQIHRLMPADERISHLVIMGMGEPLANLKNLLPALDLLHEGSATVGLGISARRITISTVGLPDKMRELSRHRHPYHLAVSLHAPEDELRNRIVPVNKNIGIEAIMQAADEYFDVTGRRVTYEYVLLAGINDSRAQAVQLGKLLKRRCAHVNLIPMNRVAPIDLSAPAAPQTAQFLKALDECGVSASVRKRKGADIDAACGQLRLNAETVGTPQVQ